MRHVRNSPDQALALSLIKRAADLAIGVPGLVALQILEGERFTAIFSRREQERRVCTRCSFARSLKT